MKTFLSAFLATLLPQALLMAQESRFDVPSASRPMVVTAAALMQNPPAAAPAPAPAPTPPIIVLHERHGHVTPTRQGSTHTGGGNIDVAQPTSDTVVVTITGVAVAAGHPCKDSFAGLECTLEQCLEIVVNDPHPGRLKAVIEARVIGLLRSDCSCCGKCAPGTAEMCAAHAELVADSGQAVAVAIPPHSVSGGESLSLNDHGGPIEAPIAPGRFTLHQAFTIHAAHPRCLLPCKPASAEFAPDPALDPLWISYREPFHGAIKKDFGFQIIVKAVPDTSAQP